MTKTRYYIGQKTIPGSKLWMKYLSVIVILFSVSCKMPKFKIVESERPYITLKTGKTIQADVVETQTSKHGATKIIADFETYAPDKVAFYSDGKSTFGNIKDSTFSKKVVEGKINLYTDNLNSYGRPASSKPLYYYAQKSEAKELTQFSYDILKTMIPPDNAAIESLNKYRSLNKFSKIMGGAGIAITAAGIFQIAQDKKGTPGLPSNPSGVFISAIGIWSFITAAIINEENKVNLFKAVKEYNSE